MSLEQLHVMNPAQGGIDGNNGDDNLVSTEQSPEDQADVKQLMRKFKAWKKHRDMYSKPWLEYYKLYRGNQWGRGRNTKWKNTEIVNLIWQTVQSSAPMQTDVRPKFVFLPVEPQDMPFAQLVEKISEQDWDKWGWMQTVLEVILDGYIYGTGISSMMYDPTLLYGLGAPVFNSEEPFYIFPDPDCVDMNDEKSEGLIHAYPVTTSKLRAKYPKFADKIRPNVKDWLKAQKSDIKSENFFNFHQSTTMQMPESYLDSTANEDCVEKTLVYEFFLKPNDVEEYSEDDPNEGKRYVVKKKYPNGRHVVVACGIKLEDGDLPYKDLAIPFARYINYCDSRNFWGISEIEALESPQRMFNKILSYALDIVLYCSNPGWIVSNDSDLDTENITNEPGKIWEINPGSEARRIEGSQLPSHFMAILDRLVEWFNDIAGRSEFSQGNAEGGVTAASAIEQLIAASRTRIRQKQRNLDEFLKQVGRQYLNRILEFYTVPRVYRMTDEAGGQYWMKFSVDQRPGVDQMGQPQVDESGQPVMKTAAVMQVSTMEGGKLIQSEPQVIFLNGELDVTVKAGSDLPFEAADKERKALALFDRQIIDAEEVLDQLQYPNKEKVLMRLQEQQQQAAMAQQQAQPEQGV